MDGDSLTYFDGFGVKHIPEEIKKFVGKKGTTKIYQIQVYNSIMCGYFCIGFIDFICKGKKKHDKFCC